MSFDFSEEALRTLLHWTIERSSSDQVEVSISGGRRSVLVFQDQDAQDQTEEALWLRVRALKESRQGFCSGVAITSDFSESGIHAVLARAEAIARSQQNVTTTLGVVDPAETEVVAFNNERRSIASGSARTAEVAAQAIIRGMHHGFVANGVIEVTEGDFADKQGIVAFGNSLGRFAYYRRTNISISLAIQKRTDQQLSAIGSISRSHWGELDTESFLSYVFEKAQFTRQSTPLAPGSYLIGFESAAIALLIQQILPAFTATTIAENRSWLRTRRHVQIAAPQVSLRADPGDPRVRMRDFDGEGWPTAPLHLIRNGIHEEIAIARRAALRRDETPNGYGPLLPSNAPETPWGIILDVEGQGNCRALMSRIGIPTLWVSELSQVFPFDSEMLSARTKGGVLELENGIIQRSFHDITLRLPIWRLLSQLIDASEPELVGNMAVPAIIFYDVEVC